MLIFRSVSGLELISSSFSFNTLAVGTANTESTHCSGLPLPLEIDSFSALGTRSTFSAIMQEVYATGVLRQPSLRYILSSDTLISVKFSLKRSSLVVSYFFVTLGSAISIDSKTSEPESIKSFSFDFRESFLLIRFFSFVGEIFFLIHDDVDIDDDIELNVDTEFDVDLVSDPSTVVVRFALFDNFSSKNEVYVISS